MILCLVEHVAGVPTPPSLEALALARRLGPAEAVVFGPEGRGAAEALRSYGAGRAHLVSDSRLDAFLPEAWGHALAELARSSGADAVVATGSDRGNEVMAHVGAILGQPLAANCTAVEPGETYTVIRQRWGGSLLEEARLQGAPKLLTTAVGSFAVAPEPAAGFAIVEVAPAIPDKAFRVRPVAVESGDSSQVSLGEARFVVGGGRGVGGPDGFAPLAELAGLLGGALGCSRAVTSAGWRPHAEQIGQTGERITADLYIACGISGAMQHIVGAKGARHILAVNTDPEATIMNYADYAIIGNLHEVVPAIVAEVKKAQGG